MGLMAPSANNAALFPDPSNPGPTSSDAAPHPVSMHQAQVIVGATHALDVLDYRIPASLSDSVHPGTPVSIPLGSNNRSVWGYVVSTSSGMNDTQAVPTLKEILGLDPDRPTLPQGIIQLVLFAARHYAAPPSVMLAAVLPNMARSATTRFKITQEGRDALQPPHPSRIKPDDLALLTLAQRFNTGFTVAACERDLGWTRKAGTARLKRCTERGWLTRVQQRAAKARQVVMYRRVGASHAHPNTTAHIENHAPLSSRQKAAHTLLPYIPTDDVGIALTTLKTLPHHIKSLAPALTALVNAGLIERITQTQHAIPTPILTHTDEHHTLTPEQAHAVSVISEPLDARRFQTVLLQGVTGSGKTEVYLQLIARTLDMNRNALVLVPEIALTPQLSARFKSRFGDLVATFHSGLTVAERRDEWERIHTGVARIGVGARSALFLPIQNLGLLIVDEEHEASFKQDETPRYNARDLAVFRGQQENAVVVLGSATPSLESRYNAQTERYTLIRMQHRVQDRPLPTVECVDLRNIESPPDAVFSPPLLEALESTLRKGEQAILFLNRRGFAPYVFCRDCGHSFRCVDCNVGMTLHQRRHLLLCHYCGHQMPSPETCTQCHSYQVYTFGLGTERIEAEVKHLFGDIGVTRLDRDTVQNRTALTESLRCFSERRAQVMIGTQMVAKGHDFPGVTLVGVIAADSALNLPDFRAAERTFQLLTQVAGRAGRGTSPGRVLVQTYAPDHYAIQAAQHHAYDQFADTELEFRRELNYPPFAHLLLLRFEGMSEAYVQQATRAAAEQLHLANDQLAEGVWILGPAPAPLSRLKGMYRIQILLKGPTRRAVRRLLHTAALRPPNDVRLIVDVDPMNML